MKRQMSSVPTLLTIIAIILMSCRNERGKKPSSTHANTDIHPFEGTSAETATKFESEVVSLTESAEFGITFTADMKTLFFTSKRGEDKDFCIYTSRFENNKWQPAGIASFSGKYFDADAFIDPQDDKLYFFSMRPRGKDTIPLEMPNIWYTGKKEGSWAEPKMIKGDINSPTSGEGYLSLTKNGTMYFSTMGRLEGKQHDIFKSTSSDHMFSEPEYVEIDIDTSFSNPFISPDEDFLLIDSRQAGGLGGNDLYFVKRLRGNTWSKPVNIGPKINTPGDEGTPSLSPDGKWLFFSRDGDIYFISAEAALSDML